MKVKVFKIRSLDNPAGFGEEYLQAKTVLTGTNSKTGLSGASKEKMDLPAGSYWVTITTEHDKGSYQATIHIYPGMLTHMEVEADKFLDPTHRAEADVNVDVDGTILTFSEATGKFTVDKDIFYPNDTFNTYSMWYVNGNQITGTENGVEDYYILNKDIRVRGAIELGGIKTIDGDPAGLSRTTTVTRTDGPAANSAVITVAGGDVTFKNITINGKSGVANRGLLVTGTGTKVTLGTGTAVTGATAADDGGAILVENGARLKMENDSTVTGRATRGGGLSTGNMGCTIAMSGNKAARGGGVDLYNVEFTMSGGTISGNTAVNGNGGGVYVEKYDTCKFIRTGGTVYGKDALEVLRNTASGTGAALYKEGPDAIATLRGEPLEIMETDIK